MAFRNRLLVSSDSLIFLLIALHLQRVESWARIVVHQHHHRYLFRAHSYNLESPICSCHGSCTKKWRTTKPRRRRELMLHAKRNKRAQSRQDEADLNRWYDAVDADASPDDVFWEEMERQRLLAKVGGSGGGGDSSSASSGSVFDSTKSPSSNAYPYSSSASSTDASSSQSLAKTNSILAMASMNGQAQRSAEATLSEYAAFACSDNWLDEELAWMMNSDELYDFNTDDDYLDEDVKYLDEQLGEWESLEDSDDLQSKSSGADGADDYEANAWMQSDEPWDHWGEKEEKEKSSFKFNSRADIFLFRDEDIDEKELQSMEDETLARLSKLSLKSLRLERARNSPKAKAYFQQRPPDASEGFDRMWVSAIDNVCFKNLVGLFSNYGVQFADNFGDWQDSSMDDSMASIEDIALSKARKVYEVTGLPCIASRSSFEIEPVPINLNTGSGTLAGRSAAIANANPRVASGYRFNDIGMHVDYICEALRPLSEPHRVTRFKTCLCFYDGQMELFDYGTCDVDLYFANSLRTFIPVSQAINELLQKLIITFNLEYQQWIKSRLNQGISGGALGTASVKLRDRVLKEGRVLPNDIIDVSAFMDSKVDVNLMDHCAEELSNRFVDQKPSKILTVATTGLVIALPMAKYLQVPVVYARKERNVVMSDTFKVGYSSKTVGLNRELFVSKSHLDESDRVLIVDDFLSSGSSQEALLRIVYESGAMAVGVAVLLEKVFDSGRQSLSGFNVPIHSLCRIVSVTDGVIQLEEEEGYDRMQKFKER